MTRRWILERVARRMPLVFRGTEFGL
jgi:hypothetical protein